MVPSTAEGYGDLWFWLIIHLTIFCFVVEVKEINFVPKSLMLKRILSSNHHAKTQILSIFLVAAGWSHIYLINEVLHLDIIIEVPSQNIMWTIICSPNSKWIAYSSALCFLMDFRAIEVVPQHKNYNRGAGYNSVRWYLPEVVWSLEGAGYDQW